MYSSMFGIILCVLLVSIFINDFVKYVLILRMKNILFLDVWVFFVLVLKLN